MQTCTLRDAVAAAPADSLVLFGTSVSNQTVTLNGELLNDERCR